MVDAALAAGQRSLLGVIVRLGATLVPLDSADAHKLGNLNDGAALGLAAPAPSSLVAVTSVRLRRGARSEKKFLATRAAVFNPKAGAAQISKVACFSPRVMSSSAM